MAVLAGRRTINVIDQQTDFGEGFGLQFYVDQGKY